MHFSSGHIECRAVGREGGQAPRLFEEREREREVKRARDEHPGYSGNKLNVALFSVLSAQGQSIEISSCPLPLFPGDWMRKDRK